MMHEPSAKKRRQSRLSDADVIQRVRTYGRDGTLQAGLREVWSKAGAIIAREMAEHWRVTL
jgi:hypothetical protein